MKAPSFRCTERPEDGALVLHYYSDRPGLEYIVIGIVKVCVSSLYCMVSLQRTYICFLQAVASKLHETEVDVQIFKTKDDSDHVQFLIIEKSAPNKQQLPEIAEIETLSLGKSHDFFILSVSIYGNNN